MDDLAVQHEGRQVTLPAPLRSAAYAGGALLALNTADHDLAAQLARQSLELADQCGHQSTRWRAQEMLGLAALYQADYDTALSLLTECRREYARLGLGTDHACVTRRLGHLHRLRGDYPAARAEFAAAQVELEQVGDLPGLGWVLSQLGVLTRYEGGPPEQAAEYYRRAAEAFEALGDAGGAAHVRYSMGDLARLVGDHTGAAEHYEASLAVLRSLGDRRCQASIVYNLGLLALAEKDARASEHLRRSLAIRQELNDQAGIAECLEALAMVADREGDADQQDVRDDDGVDSARQSVHCGGSAMAKYDIKVAHRDLYAPSAKDFSIVDVPRMTYLAVDGAGDPNTSGEYAAAVEALFTVAYTVKAHSRTVLGRDFVVAPLEGLWRADDLTAFIRRDKAAWQWTMLIALPDWITGDVVETARATARRKKELPAIDAVTVRVLTEGLCVQILHIGSYDDEGPVLDRLHNTYLPEQGLRPTGDHHEIYVSDPRRTAPAKLRTILRQPVAPASSSARRQRP